MINNIIVFGEMIISTIFCFNCQKVINFERFTLRENHISPPRFAKKTYLYFLIGEYNIPIGLFFDLILILEYKKENNQEKLSISEIISEKEEEIENPNSNN